MSNWIAEYERRLRRVAGVTNDTLNVHVNVVSEIEYGGGCDTCSYESPKTVVEIVVDGTVEWSKSGWDAFGALQRALADFDDDDDEIE